MWILRVLRIESMFGRLGPLGLSSRPRRKLPGYDWSGPRGVDRLARHDDRAEAGEAHLGQVTQNGSLPDEARARCADLLDASARLESVMSQIEEDDLPVSDEVTHRLFDLPNRIDDFRARRAEREHISHVDALRQPVPG